MIDSQSPLNPFQCPSHPEEHIICFSKNPTDKKLLFCVHCMLSASPSTKENIVALKIAIEEVYTKVFSEERLLVDDSSLDPLLEAFDTKVDAIGNLKEHIEKEKQRITDEFTRLENDIVKSIDQTKTLIFKKLDAQLDALKNNYAVFRQKLQKHSDFDNARRVSSLDEFYKELNKCNSSEALEQSWRELLEDLKDTNTYAVYGNKAKRILEDKLEEYRKMIRAGQKIFPKSLVDSGTYYITAKDEFTTNLRFFLDRCLKLDCQVLKHEEFLRSINLTGCLDSIILQPYDVPLLENVSGRPIYNMSLEYRVSRDGPDLNAIKNIFNGAGADDVMLLIKTVSGQVIGYRRTIVKNTVQGVLKTIQRGTVFSLKNQLMRYEDKEIVQQSKGILDGITDFIGGSNSNPKETHWPASCFWLHNPVTLLKETGCVEILSTLDGKMYYPEPFAPREVEVFRFM